MINDAATPHHIEWDEERRVKRSYYEISDGVFAVKTEYFCDELIDMAAEARARAPKRWGDGFVHVASIPGNFYEKYVRPALDQKDDKYIARLLNDGDWAKFRTRDGKV